MERVRAFRILPVLLLVISIPPSGTSAQSSATAGRALLTLDSMPLHAQLAMTRPVTDLATVPSEIPMLAAPPQGAIFYSDGFYLRLDIHRYASYATLPLFVGQYLVGRKLYDGTGSGSLRGLHQTLSSGTILLFGVNGVTGIWNAWEARKNPAGRGKRILHGALMFASGLGFLATQNSGPESEGGGVPSRDSIRKHRNIAIVSMAVATVGYVYMLLKG